MAIRQDLGNRLYEAETLLDISPSCDGLASTTRQTKPAGSTWTSFSRMDSTAGIGGSDKQLVADVSDGATVPRVTDLAPVQLASTETAKPSGLPQRQPIAWLSVSSAILVVGAVLAATASGYGYHRDELYFLMLKPAWGYVDQPPLTPLLARAAVNLFGAHPGTLRIPAVVCVAVAILLSALIARELGGGRLAQAFAAWGYAVTTGALITGHVLSTATVDLVLWPAVLLCVTRAQLHTRKWWLAAGVLVGLSFYNKLLIILMLIGLGVSLLIVGPRRVLRSPWLWGGVVLALAIGAPNLIYQATHDFPQLKMAQALSSGQGDDRVLMLPAQILLIGVPLFWLSVRGFQGLWQRPQWRPVKFIALAYVVALVLSLASAGQVYYPFGLLVYLLAAGSVVVAERRPGRTGVRWLATAVTVNGVVAAFLALPLLSVTAFGATPIGAINPTQPDQVGWPTYVRTVADWYNRLPAADQANTVLVTGNYGEAGALVFYGKQYGLPPVYSGHNQLYYYGPPPYDRTIALIWTEGTLDELSTNFRNCQQLTTMDNGVGVDNEEQGSILALCRDPHAGWAALWPLIQHYD